MGTILSIILILAISVFQSASNHTPTQKQRDADMQKHLDQVLNSHPNWD